MAQVGKQESCEREQVQQICKYLENLQFVFELASWLSSSRTIDHQKCTFVCIIHSSARAHLTLITEANVVSKNTAWGRGGALPCQLNNKIWYLLVCMEFNNYNIYHLHVVVFMKFQLSCLHKEREREGKGV